jgi:hypothetical protein
MSLMRKEASRYREKRDKSHFGRPGRMTNHGRFGPQEQPGLNYERKLKIEHTTREHRERDSVRML